MCGIVGYLGERNPKDVLIKGLKTLEYRGYDSSGVAIFDEGVCKRVRAKGKLVALEEKLEGVTFSGTSGIAHTRWATHGPPNETNAHPHCSKEITLVHNGIIENYETLKKEIIKRGGVIESDTDSELVAHLISFETGQGVDLLTAVQNVLPVLEGAYSILVISEKEPDKMIAFKNGPPLLIGVEQDGSVVVASDVQAIVPYTQDVFYLDDNDIAIIEKGKVDFVLPSGIKIEKKSTFVDWSPEQAEKQGYAHYMLKEIYEQPRAVAQSMEPHINLEKSCVQLSRVGFDCESLSDLSDIDREADYKRTLQVLEATRRVYIVACGTSYYAGMVGKYLIEEWARVPVEVDIASEFRYRNPVITTGSLVITISQSGETADTLAALRLAKEQGAKVLSICNVPRSTIDREADGHIYMNAGVEIGVASTKAFTCTQALLSLVAVEFAKAKGELTSEKEQEVLQGMVSLPSHMEVVLAHDSFFAQASEKLKKYKGFLYMGRGIQFPIALEGALKLKELAYMHAEGYAAGEMKHGPLALIDERMAVVMIAPDDQLYDKTVSNLEEARARGGQVISIGTEGNDSLKELSLSFLTIPKAPWYLNPILAVIPLQLLSYHVAEALGHDVDQPRNLAKSVTVE